MRMSPLRAVTVHDDRELQAIEVNDVVPSRLCSAETAELWMMNSDAVRVVARQSEVTGQLMDPKLDEMKLGCILVHVP